jgi:hypothetical protein
LVKKLSERFDQLDEEMKAIDATQKLENGEFGPYPSIDKERLLAWTVKVKHLLASACGIDSQHYESFVEVEKPRAYEYPYDRFQRMRAVLAAASDDYKGGFLIAIKNLIQAEVFDSELEQAEELLDNGYKLAAAVIAGVVLETTLRDLCSREGIPHGKLDKMNADLTKAGLYNKLQQKRITALADIRNSAAHGKPEEFSEQDVTNMIRDIETFVATQLT